MARPAVTATAADTALAEVIGWWRAHARPLPWRSSRDVYAVWVSEVMSVQTGVTRCTEVWQRWMARWPTVEDLAAASLADVLAIWQGLGYPRRARDLHRSAQIVARDGWPADLRELPGVGAYVDAAVRCFAREEPVLPLDINVRRVLHRRFASGVDVTEDPWTAGQALMEFGQRICAAQPRCGECPVSMGCEGPRADEPRGRRQRPYAGSLRQRRGRLLARVLAEGSLAVSEADAVVAAGLAADRLVVLEDGRLRAPT